MSRSARSQGLSAPVWLPLVLMVAALVWRVLYQQGMVSANLGNLSPLMAFAFAGAIVFPRTLPWWSWAGLLILVDWVSMGSQWWVTANGREAVLLTYGCYVLAAWWGARLRGKAGVVDTVLGTLVCSVGFYLVTNSLSWAVEPYYAKTWGGWVQALTVGKEGLPPTLMFFRNSLIADLLGATAIVAAYNAEALVRKLRVMPVIGWGRQSQAAVAA
jgi:hypothetical protein